MFQFLDGGPEAREKEAKVLWPFLGAIVVQQLLNNCERKDRARKDCNNNCSLTKRQGAREQVLWPFGPRPVIKSLFTNRYATFLDSYFCFTM